MNEIYKTLAEGYEKLAAGYRALAKDQKDGKAVVEEPATQTEPRHRPGSAEK